MVTPRDGDEVDLLDASLRTAGGALSSTTLYVLSGVVYVTVTSAAVTGTYFFVTIVAALLLRPVRGVSQALRKVGSERGEVVGPYFGVAVLFAAGYLACTGLTVLALEGVIVRGTVFTAGLLPAVGLYGLAVAVSMVVTGLLGAVGYPGVETWLAGAQSAVQYALLLALAPVVSTVADLLVVTAAVRLLLYAATAAYVGVRPAVPSRHALARTWRFARWSVPDQVLDRLSYNMPVYVLGIVGTPAAVGVYETADRLADFGATISWRLSSPLLTRVSGDASAGDDRLAYLDGAITGGTGVTVVVFGYLLAAHDVLAGLVFADAQGAFSATVLLVGGVNVCRGFWTLTSHAIEGIGKPAISFRTKLYGLAVGVPVTAAFGTALGAVAGAAGYTVMNLVVGGYVGYHARALLGRVPLDRSLAAHLAVGLGVAVAVTTGAVAALRAAGLQPLAVAVLAAAACILGFGAALSAVSRPTRRVLSRAADLYGGPLRAVLP